MNINLTKEDIIEIFENSISFIITLAMFIYGIGKLIQFDEAILISKKIPELTGMELMWAFYGYSKSFALVLGFFEILGGTLILINKTRIIGCVFTSTILINVIIQDIFFDVIEGALRSAILYQLLILIILWINRKKVIDSVKALYKKKQSKFFSKKYLLKLSIAFILFIVLRITEYYITSYH